MSCEGARNRAEHRCDWGDRKAVDWHREARISSCIGVMLVVGVMRELGKYGIVPRRGMLPGFVDGIIAERRWREVVLIKIRVK